MKISDSHRRANIRADWKNKIKFMFYSKIWCNLLRKDCVFCGIYMKCERYTKRGWFD